ncbi:serine/threonine protein kinase [Arcanobacterium haemolyticum]|nr:serine/threonine protein kinase [Arcanobacterium haemolyticum]
MRERIIGGYKLIKRIGYGGMSTVFAAEDAAGSRVALKLLHPSVVASASGRERLRREVRMLQKVKGPFVAEVLDAETDDDEAFIVTELIDGPTLEQDVVDNGIFTEEDLVHLAEQLRDAVDSIHRGGVLHRDLKPSNVMMGPRGPVLIDFGIAQLDDDSRLTQAGSLSHTPGYCDPRVIEGASPDEAADWWALAAIVAFAATGNHPYGSGGSPAVMRRVVTGDVNLSGLSAELAGAFARALSPRPAERISFDELIEVIRSPESGQRFVDANVTPPTIVDDPAATYVPDWDGEVVGDEDSPGGVSDRAVTAVVNEGVGAARNPGWHGDPTEGVSPGHVLPHDGRANEAPLVAQSPRTDMYETPTLVAQPGGNDTHVLPMVAMPESYGPSVVAQPSSMPTSYPPSLPEWMRPAPPARMLLVAIASILVALASSLPAVATFVYVACAVIATIVGSVHASLHTRRMEKGGPFKAEGLYVCLRLPWHFVKALFIQAISAGIGIFFAVAVVWVLGSLQESATIGYLGRLVLSIGMLVEVLASWNIGTNVRARQGARLIARSIAPSAGYRAFWVVVFVGAAAALAFYLFTAGVKPNWVPLTQPSFYTG